MTTPINDGMPADPDGFIMMHQTNYPDAQASATAFELVWSKLGWLEGPTPEPSSPPSSSPSSTSSSSTGSSSSTPSGSPSSPSSSSGGS